MFNVYAFEKKLGADDELKKMKEDYIKDETIRKSKSLPAFLLSYFIQRNKKKWSQIIKGELRISFSKYLYPLLAPLILLDG